MSRGIVRETGLEEGLAIGTEKSMDAEIRGLPVAKEVAMAGRKV